MEPVFIYNIPKISPETNADNVCTILKCNNANKTDDTNKDINKPYLPCKPPNIYPLIKVSSIIGAIKQICLFFKVFNKISFDKF